MRARGDTSPMRATKESGRRRSVRSTWARVIVLFAILILVTGGGALVLSQRQAEHFAATTAQSEAEMGAFALLQHEILAAGDPMSAVLYEFDRDAALEEQWNEWTSSHRVVTELFTRLQEAVNAHGSEDLRKARADAIRQVADFWAAVGDGVSAAKSAWGTSEVAEALVAGSDPFGVSVWEPYKATQRELAQLSVAGVTNMRAASDQASRSQDTTETVVAVALVLALMVGILGGRRMSKRVINPLVSLRSTVAHLQQGDLTGPVPVPPSAGSEVLDLAEAIADMATALGASQAHLRDQAYTDGLTGLANRRAFNEVLDAACASGCDSRTSVFLVDVDDFKDVNDSLGHAVGDRLLAVVAERLQAQARSTDTVARIGGDEFAMIIRGADSLGAAVAVAERLMAAFEDELSIDGARLRVSCSVGIADGHGAASADEIVRHADAALYVAKGRGKNCYEPFDPMLHATMLSRASLKDELHTAAHDDQLELHYQPIIDLDSDEVIGFEALVRWRHPERGLLMPAAFIEIAEESGAIVGIGDWVIDRACRDLGRLQEVPMTRSDPMWIAVNVSARQIANGKLVHTVRRALDRHGVDPRLLVLELTEAHLLNDPAHASAVLDELRADGVRIAIDDFGTGFSSLQYLTELPVDILKIDRSFVRDPASGDTGGVVLLEAIASMGKGLGLGLIAEGIEEPAELERVQRLGSIAGQGYLFAHPMTADDALAFLDCRSLALRQH